MHSCPRCGYQLRMGGRSSGKTFNQDMRIKFGKFKGHYQWDLAVDWFQTSNDTFYKVYGFNYVPKGQLFEQAKEYVFQNGRKTTQNISVEVKQSEVSQDEIIKSISEQLSKNLRSSNLSGGF